MLATVPVVLVVEDDDAIRAGFARVLARAGFSVLDAPDARTAIGLALGLGRADLFLCDLNLPDMRGEQLVEKLAELLPRTKILFLSGEDPGALDLTAAAFLAKPVRTVDLLARVRDLIGPGDIAAN